MRLPSPFGVYDVVDSVIRSFYTDLSLLTLFPLIVVMKTMLLL